VVATFRQPFDLLAESVVAERQVKPTNVTMPSARDALKPANNACGSRAITPEYLTRIANTSVTIHVEAGDPFLSRNTVAQGWNK
jgi:hypothetical protein